MRFFMFFPLYPSESSRDGAGHATLQDKNAGNSEAQARFQDISLAYSILSDGKKRKYFDETGAAQAPPPPFASRQRLVCINCQRLLPPSPPRASRGAGCLPLVIPSHSVGRCGSLECSDTMWSC